MNNKVAGLCIILVATFFGSCGLLDKNNSQADESEVLDSAPFRTLTDSIDEFPKEAGLYVKRGELLSQKNHHKLASSDFKKAWELKPDESTAMAYSSILFMSGKEDDAIRLLKECIRKFPQNSEFSRRLSEAYHQMGRSKEAMEQYNVILQSQPDNFEAWYDKGVLLAELKDTAGAIIAIEKAYELQPLKSFGVSLANLYAETKNPKALQLCDDLIRKDSAQELTDAIYIKGVYFSNIDEPSRALEQFEYCISRDWKFTEAYIEKGIILYKQKNYDEALKTFALAARVSNTYPDAYYWMGRCFESNGNKEEAMDNYKRALALDINFSEAREALQRVGREDNR